MRSDKFTQKAREALLEAQQSDPPLQFRVMSG